MSLVDALMVALAETYRMERELGRGGMGVVHLAWDIKHNRRVAVKVLRPELASVIGRDRFLREIDIAANLAHPHILPLHDSGEDNGTLYYVMPYVEGESLAGRIRRDGMLDIDDALRIGREVADALAYAHDRGVVHRDIKPGNILLESGNAVVADFGLAVLLRSESAARLTTSGFTVGTPVYMSPEQSLGHHDIDGRSDVYSLGCVLYEMLCGEPPFGARDPQAILARKMGPLPSLCLVRDTVSEPVEQVTLKALHRNPADRFHSAAEFGRALHAATIEQHRATPTYSAGAAASPVTVRAAGRRSFRAWSPQWIVALIAGFIALSVLIGATANLIYDVRMAMPAEHASIARNAMVTGIRALIPGAILGALWFGGYLVLKQLSRLVVRWAHAISSVEQSVQSWQHSFSLRRLVTDKSEVLAELFFLAITAASLVVLFTFGSFLGGLWNDSNAIFAENCKAAYHNYSIAMSGAVVGLAISAVRTVRYFRARGAPPGSVRLVRTGSAAVILVMILFMTVPWRLYYDNSKPRALLDGDSVYILVDDPGRDMVIYHAATGTTGHYQSPALPNLERLGTDGYVFEHETGCGPSL